MKILLVIFLFLILLVLIINSEFTDNDKKIINKTKKIISNFSNNLNTNNNKEISIAEKNGIITFLKNKLNYDEIMIPKNLIYEKINNNLIFKNIKIIGINYENTLDKKTSHNIDLIFTINKDKMFLSQHYLYGNNGTFTLKILDKNINSNLVMIPDIIHLTSEDNLNNQIESDTELNTTESKDVIIPSLL
jgi:hypothetical protein